MRMKDIIRQFVNIVAFLGVVTVNGLANTLPLNNMPTGEISDSFPNLFVPAGYVFAIWGGDLSGAAGLYGLPGPALSA